METTEDNQAKESQKILSESVCTVLGHMFATDVLHLGKYAQIANEKIILLDAVTKRFSK